MSVHVVRDQGYHEPQGRHLLSPVFGCVVGLQSPYHAHKCIMFVSAALRMNDVVKTILMIVTWRPARSSPDALSGPPIFPQFLAVCIATLPDIHVEMSALRTVNYLHDRLQSLERASRR
jgi:hypothetical protein